MSSFSMWLSSTEGKVAIAFIGSTMLVTIGAFLRTYFGARAKTTASAHDIKSLTEQLKINTETIKRIEQTYSRGDVLWRMNLDYRERQLSEFYGPAYAIVKTEADIHHLWFNGQMRDVNLKVKQYFHEHNNKIIELIVSKAHLIEGTEMPDCFVRFITDAVVFGMYAVPTEDGEVPTELANNPRVQYPLDFNEHIILTTEKLKAQLETLREGFKQSK